ncbi:ATPase, T2SS/T4P/T4SS family [Moritella viscosa]|uniref:Hypothetical type II secretion protein n=1 Tax=Moritella viscosa TaxID=80854 RepID=A0ABY1HKH2_9GAMM|nr:ATPase, T2SS/T4P/T4SS family [Moritella viscosa]SGZ00301.1 Hypothetical type II secretion protein [Moritella viscosa]
MSNESGLYLKNKALIQLCLEDRNTYVTDEFEINTADPKSPKHEAIYDLVKSLPEMVGKPINCVMVDKVSVEMMHEMMTQFHEKLIKKEGAKLTELQSRLAAICQTAIERNTSDIHLEVERGRMRILMRVDGERELIKELHNGGSAEHNTTADAEQLVTLIFSTLGGQDVKITDPANGRFDLLLSYKGEPKKFEWRAALIPLSRGFKLTLRCLTPRDKPIGLDDMDLPVPYLTILRSALKKRNGAIVVCGPVGSGKSSLVNAMLAEMDSIGRSIHCMEDPVEFELEHVCKTTVEPDKETVVDSGKYRDYAFYTKETLRHDVDVANIGEVRDNKAAREFCRKGEVGGLVLTTLHTNSAYGVPQTFIESLNVPPAIVGAPDLMLMFVHARLVKKLCSCALDFSASATEKAYQDTGNIDDYNLKRAQIHALFYEPVTEDNGVEISLNDNIYKPNADVSNIRIANPKGCQKCNFQGERGRLSVMEIIALEAEDRRYIVNQDTHGWLAHLKKNDWPDISVHTKSRIRNGQVDISSAVKQVDKLIAAESNTIYQQMREAL